MFDQMKAMGALAGLLKNQDKLKEAGERLQRRLDEVRVVGAAGGGAVRVTMTGKMRTVEVELEPSIFAGSPDDAGGPERRAITQDLIAEAVNDAARRAQEVMREETEKMARELDLPPIPGMDKLLGA